MRRQAYLKQLARDVDRWRQAGLISEALAPQLLAEAGPTPRSVPMRHLLLGLGSLLMGLAALSLMAANWSYLPDAVKLGVLGLALWGGLGAAGYADVQREPRWREAALLFVALLFGVTVMQVGQIFHLPADRAGGVLLWSLGALVVALVGPSRSALTVALVLGGIWSGLEITNQATPHWAYLPLWLALAATALLRWRQPWSVGLHLVVLSFVGWSAAMLMKVGVNYEPSPFSTFASFALLWLGLWFAALWAREPGQVAGPLDETDEESLATLFKPVGERARVLAALFSHYAPFPILGSIFALQFFTSSAPSFGGDTTPLAVLWPIGLGVAGAFVLAAKRRGWQRIDAGALAVASGLLFLAAHFPVGPPVLVMEGLLLVFSLFLIAGAWRAENRLLTNLGFVLFGLQVCKIYISTIGALLGDAMLFASSGLMLIGLSFALERLRRRIMGSPDGPDGGGSGSGATGKGVETPPSAPLAGVPAPPSTRYGPKQPASEQAAASAHPLYGPPRPPHAAPSAKGTTP